jgi:hypothetical protein
VGAGGRARLDALPLRHGPEIRARRRADGGRAVAPPDLTGAWRLVRRIRDARLGLTGRARGSATLTRHGGFLRYEEAARLTFGAFEGESSRVLRFLQEGARLRVQFEDGRPFFEADLSRARALLRHPCPPDEYCGRVRLLGPDRWAQVWKAEGPRKRLVIATLYRRETPRDRSDGADVQRLQQDACRHQDILI